MSNFYTELESRKRSVPDYSDEWLREDVAEKEAGVWRMTLAGACIVGMCLVVIAIFILGGIAAARVNWGAL
jgi:hypothetical protein